MLAQSAPDLFIAITERRMEIADIGKGPLIDARIAYSEIKHAYFSAHEVALDWFERRIAT